MPIWRTCLVFVFPLIFLVACQTLPSVQPDDLLIANAAVIDIDSGDIRQQDVLIRQQQIVGVYPAGTLNRPSHYIDASGQYLIPGLWDMHVHLTGDPRISSQQMLQMLLQNGVTSVRDTGASLDDMQAVRQQLQTDTSLSPQVYWSGPMLDGEPRVFDGSNRMFPDMAISVGNPEQGRAAVDRLHTAGVDFIKVYELIDPLTLQAVLDQAAQYQLPVTAHLPLSTDLSQTDIEGLTGMEHLRNLEFSCVEDPATMTAGRQQTLQAEQQLLGNKLRQKIYRQQRQQVVAARDDDACQRVIEQLAAAGIAQVPTLSTIALHYARWYRDPEWLATFELMPDEVAKEWFQLARFLNLSSARLPDYRRDLINWQMETVLRLQQAGVPILAGTDTPILIMTPGYSLHRELQLLVSAGLSNLEALQAATINPAAWFGLSDQVGKVRAGMRADLVLLDDNPLESIANTRSIHSVIVAGARVTIPLSDR